MGLVWQSTSLSYLYYAARPEKIHADFDGFFRLPERTRGVAGGEPG
jgi:hypothetical protein